MRIQKLQPPIFSRCRMIFVRPALRNNGLEAVLKQYETVAVQYKMTKFTLEIVGKSNKKSDFVTFYFVRQQFHTI